MKPANRALFIQNNEGGVCDTVVSQTVSQLVMLYNGIQSLL